METLIQSDRLLFRPTRSDNIPFVMMTESDEENSRFVLQWTADQHEQASKEADVGHIVIETIGERKQIGYLIVAGLQNPHQSVELKRIAITEKGKGYGREALKLIKRWVFEHARAHRFWLDVKEQNARARHLYETEGFIVEGVTRECLKNGDSFESLVVMSMLRPDYHRAERAKA